MDRPHIVVATPCFGGQVTSSYLMSMLRLTQWAGPEGIKLDATVLGGDSLISRARSTLVSHFLAVPEATHLLFIDADIGFEVESVRRMLAFDQDFVAGLYPLKMIDWAKVPARVLAGEPLERAGLTYVGTPCTGDDLRVEDGFATAVYAGTGFQLIKRRVFETMMAAHPELKFTVLHTAADHAPKDNLYALFDCMIDPDTGAYLSEDYAFCRRWRALGGTIHLDLRSRLTHTGPGDYAGDCTHRFAALDVGGEVPASRAA